VRSKVSHHSKLQKRHLVSATASKLRDMILAREPEARLGSLKEIARLLSVGIVTVQQAARVLEHEGILSVRRGPGGGYYGTRPDEAALERSFGTFLLAHGFGYREALEMMSLLDCEIIPAAARSADDAQREVVRDMSERADLCYTTEQRIAFEHELRELLGKLVSRPLIEFLTKVTRGLYKGHPTAIVFTGEDGVRAWKAGRRRMLQAIVQQDEALARFEAERYRQEVLARLRKS
jgi:GntR family transcriptional repressor for pyruvate dehydrogenase complex